MKNIVITGASSGIGLACAKACLAKGYSVIATARKDEDLAMLTELGCKAVWLELLSEDSVRQAATEILQLTNNNIDTLFNNAGYGLQLALEDTTWQSLEEQHRANVIGPIQLTNQLLPAMGRGSKLVFNGSVLGLFTITFRGPYCMSKYALEAAADAYRLELEPLGIAVHLIEPGPVEADFRPNALAVLKQVLGDKKTRLDYSNHLARLEFEGNTKGTLPADSCSDILLGIIDGSKRKPRYLVTRTAKLAAFLKWLLGSNFHRVAKNAEPVLEKK